MPTGAMAMNQDSQSISMLTVRLTISSASRLGASAVRKRELVIAEAERLTHMT